MNVQEIGDLTARPVVGLRPAAGRETLHFPPRVWRLAECTAVADMIGPGDKGQAGYPPAVLTAFTWAGQARLAKGVSRTHTPARPGRARDGSAQEPTDSAPPAVLPAPGRHRPCGAGSSASHNTMKKSHSTSPRMDSNEQRGNLLF